MEARRFTRREFLAGAALAASGLIGPGAHAQEIRHWWRQRTPPPSPVAVVRTDDRMAGIRQAIKLLNVNPVAGKDVLLIPDLESRAPYPMTTHLDTLAALSQALWDLRAESVTIGAQSSALPTKDALAASGLYDRLEQIEARLLNIEELGFAEWIKVDSSGGQWRRGFHLARPVLQSPCVVTACGLRTNAKGDLGMSLWLATNLLPKRDVLDRLELEQSAHPGRLVAELNQGYRPSLIVVDGLEAVIDPKLPRIHRGARLILAGTDRVAVDAAGAAALMLLGAQLGQKIFELEQIAWALILRVGISRPSQITLVAADADSQAFADQLTERLARG
ncbi:MAG: DUF362 domain-containing protein [Nitrospirota bacterium]